MTVDWVRGGAVWTLVSATFYQNPVPQSITTPGHMTDNDISHVAIAAYTGHFDPQGCQTLLLKESELLFLTLGSWTIIANHSLFDLFHTFQVCEPNILSDHCAIEFSLLSRCTISSDKSSETRANVSVNKKYIWCDTKEDQYRDNICLEESAFLDLNFHLTQVSSPHDIDSNIEKFTKVMDKICDPLFAKNVSTSNYDYNGQTKPNKQPWFDDDCHRARKTYYEELNKFRDRKTADNQRSLVNARTNFKTVLRQKRFAYDKQKTDRLIVSKNKNAKEYWKLLKQAANINSQSNITSEQFAEYFKAVNDPSDSFYQADDDVIFFNERYVRGEFQIMFDELNLAISGDEIKMAIKQLRNGASAGPDLFLIEFFKKGSNVLISYIQNLFNKIFEIGYFPVKWSEGFIIPIFKKGDINEVSNYRGITLLSTLGKLFTRILNNRLNAWAEEYNVYIEAQAGFRKHMSTIDNIFILSGLITHCLNNNETLYCAFVDFSKAFDYVVRDNVWYKLLKIGVRGKMLDIIKSMYSIVKSKIKYKNNVSEAFICNIGVRQGECLSPFLFSMYLNDLEEELSVKGVKGVVIGMFKLFLLLYADDIVIFGETDADLQNALNILEDYCSRWKLTVNTEKTKIMVFRKGGRLSSNLKFTYQDKVIEVINKFSYLGIVFTSGGSSYETQKTLSGQALKAIFTLNKYLYNFTSLKTSHVLELFDKLVTPILNYGSEVWGFYKSASIETVHLQFCKKILGIKQTTQNDFIYGELGRIDFQSQRYINIIKYWLKVVQSDNRKYATLIYDMMLNDLEIRAQKQNWALSVKNYYIG